MYVIKFFRLCSSLLRRGSFRTLPLPKYKKNAPTIIYALSERWTRLSRDTDFSFTIEPTRCAAPTCACERTRDDKSSPRARAEGRTSDSLTDLVKIRKLPSAHLQSITAFPAAGARPGRPPRGSFASPVCAKDFSL